MAEIQRINISRQHTHTIFDRYKDETAQELLTVLWGNTNEVQWIVAPTEQLQQEGSVSFDTRQIDTATQSLDEKGHDTSDVGLLHNHNRASGHGFGFSDEDLNTARTMYETKWIDRMGLLMNGYEDDDIHVQHMIVGNHEWELHDIEGANWSGKVVTMVTNVDGTKEEIYSDSIAEAEAKEYEIMMLKQQLFEEENTAMTA